MARLAASLCALVALLLSLCEAKNLAPSQGKKWLELSAQEKLNSTGPQDWGYVNVRPNAHKFWWLHYTSHADGHVARPLVMWLQGGPGASSSGYGNFEIIGPLDLDLNPRNTTWMQEASLLFVDNPVGSGYSYCDTDDAFTTDVEEIAIDLLTLTKEFYRDHADFKDSPFYIFGQSYGGKMAAAFARRLHESIEAGEFECNLQGFAMGNAWISPEDSTATWAGLLEWMSNVDEVGHQAIMNASGLMSQAIVEGRWQDATSLWRAVQTQVNTHANYVDFYNILKFRILSKTPKEEDKYWFDFLQHDRETIHSLDDLMNGQVHDYLGIPESVVWGSQRGTVFQKQDGDFMKPVIDIVDDLLKTTTMKVIVYQGQLDLICDTKAALEWVQKLTWDGLPDYNSATRLALTDPWDGQTDTFVKANGKFKFYWNLRAGHAVPKDMADPALRMLQRIIDDIDT